MSRNLADCFEPDWNQCEPCGSHKSGKACWGERRPARGARAEESTLGTVSRRRLRFIVPITVRPMIGRDSSNAWVGPNVSMPQLC